MALGNRAQTPGWETEAHLTPSTCPPFLTPELACVRWALRCPRDHHSSPPQLCSQLCPGPSPGFQGNSRTHFHQVQASPCGVSCLFLGGGREGRERERRRIRVGNPLFCLLLAGVLEQLIEALYSSILTVTVVDFLNNLPDTSDLFIARVLMFSSILGIGPAAFI